MPVAAPQTRAVEFRDAFQKRIFVADGAMGTALSGKGIFLNRCFEELNLSLPAVVRDVHRDFVRAGSEIIETNTFGANRKRLATFGVAEKLNLINRAGVRIAREASGDQAFVAGAVGPLGVRLEPLGPTTFAEARAIFREQIEALNEAGVDLLILETFRDLNELREAILAAREAAGDEMIVIAQLSVEDDGHLEDGTPVERFTRALDEWPADVIGLNCSSGPRVLLETIERMAAYTRKPLSAVPNAGLPVTVEGRSLYPCSPEYMARYARRFLESGASIVGGCCGTTPEHIREMLGETRAFEPVVRTESARIVEPAPRAAALPKIPAAEKSGLGAKLAAGRYVAIVQILPPRGADASREIEVARMCRQAAIDAIGVPDGAGARMSAQMACQLIQKQAEIEAVLQLSSRDHTIPGIQSELLGAHAGGIRNLICVAGDPPRLGADPDAGSVYGVDSIGLVRIASHLNEGLDVGGNPLGSRTALLIGVAADPGAPDLDEEMRRFEKNIEAGAELVVTRPVFDLRLLEDFVRRAERYKIPVIAGIWPLSSARDAEFVIEELRVPVPEEYSTRMVRAGTAEGARAEGIAIAQEIVRTARQMTAGVQISAPLGRYEIALEVASAIDPR